MSSGGADAPKIILTGIKPTGSPHLGNLIGAIRPALETAAHPSLTPYFFIADYHALTTIRDGGRLRQLTYEVAASWLAFGLDPNRTLFYRQSDVPEVFELSWILACLTAKGWMNKAHAYKARVSQNQVDGNEDLDAGVNMGLYTYPILMAADILLFDADLVPVGADQQQHVEIARDIAQRLNHAYEADLLRLPRALIGERTAVIPGLDGRKMSKSYDNTIPLFVPSKKLKKIINRIVTDSSPPEAPKDPETSTIFQIYRLVATPAQTAELVARYHAGIGWGEAKAALFAAVDALLDEPRERYDELMADTKRLDEILAAGADLARERARQVLRRVRETVLNRS